MAEKVSCFEMTNFQALDALTIYSNISRISLLIQITLCRNARIQMDISKKNHLSAEKAINYFPSSREIRYQYVKYLSPSVFSPSRYFQFSNGILAQRGRFTIPSSSKLEMLCQCEMNSWYYIITNSSILDDLRVRDSPLACFYFCEKDC